MTKTKLTATTPFGTFSRKTARTYTHIVLGIGTPASYLQKHYDATLANEQKNAKRYAATQARYEAGVDPRECGDDLRPAGTHAGEWDRTCTAKFLAEGNYKQWARECNERAEQLIAQGRPTCDADTVTLLGWCGRPDLASKLASSEAVSGRYVSVRIFPVDPQ